MFESLDRRPRLTFRRAEGREVMLTDQDLRGVVHCSFVKRMHDVPRTAPFQRQGRAPAHDAIEIVPPYRRKSRVKVLGHHVALKNSDGRGPQMMIQCGAYLAGFKRPNEIKMRYLPERMDARICPASTRDADAFRRKFEYRVFERVLNRRAVVLLLPANKRRAVIFEGETKARHIDKAR